MRWLRIKRIPPAIQECQRYLFFKVRGENKELSEVVNAVWKSVTKYMGTQAASRANIWVIRNSFNEGKQEGVIRVNREMENDVRAALAINPGFEDKTFLSVEKVSGTIEDS